MLFEGFADLRSVLSRAELEEKIKLYPGEIVVYPFADAKPPVGVEFNRVAQVAWDRLC